MSDMFWINLQARYDAEVTREKLATKLADIKRLTTDLG
jgi:hypothetical protein